MHVSNLSDLFHHRIQSYRFGGSRDTVLILLLRLVLLLSLSQLAGSYCSAFDKEAILVYDPSLHQARKFIFYLTKLPDLNPTPFVVSPDIIELLIGLIELLFRLGQFLLTLFEGSLEGQTLINAEYLMHSI